MNNLLYFLAQILLFSSIGNDNTYHTQLESEACNWDFDWHDNICGKEYDDQYSIYIKCNPKHQQDIEWMELSCQGPGWNWKRKESSYPFDWGWGNGKNDSRFRNMKPGSYKLICKVADKCGNINTKTCSFTVSSSSSSGNNCQGPPDNRNCPKNYNPVCGCNGKTYSNSCLAQADGVKDWSNGPCSGGGNNTNCNWDFDWADNICGKEFSNGYSIYIKCNPKKQQDIEWMELSCQGPGWNWKRTEPSYPFDWGWGNGKNDSRFRNMKPGSYKLICRVKDKCGHINTKTCNFMVSSGSTCQGPSDNRNCPQNYDPVCGCNGKTYSNSCLAQADGVREWSKGPCAGAGNSGNTNCNWDFDWHDNICGKGFSSGYSIYIKCNPKKQQDIEWMELSCQGPGWNWKRTESSYPFDWGWGNGKNDSRFHNMKPGSYKLTCRVKDKCGQTNTKTCSFIVNGS